MNNGYTQRIEQAIKAIKNAEYVLIGAGAGLSDAAGLKYNGRRFTDNFKPFIEKYKFSDLYTSSFFPFKTEEEHWAYWAKHISLNRYETSATQLYRNVLKLVQQKDYFVITTNVDGQFSKAGFDAGKIFAVQGDYAFFQCAKGCHNKLYYNEKVILHMIAQTNDCKISSALVPHCPVCGGGMDVNLRKNNYFVEDNHWDVARESYNTFIHNAINSKTVLLELGVGFNTPGIIRYPFEKITFHYNHISLLRINNLYPFGITENINKTISFNEDMSNTINTLLNN